MRTDYQAAEDVIATIKCFGLAEEFREHREAAYLEERASIVSWLREHWSERCADLIEAGEHLK